MNKFICAAFTSHTFWQTKILRREDPYLKVGEVNDRASRGTSDELVRRYCRGKALTP